MLNWGAKMKFKSKFWVLAVITGCWSWDGTTQAQPGGAPGPQHGPGPSAGSPRSSYNSPGSPYSGSRMSGPGRSMSPQGPPQATRFGSLPDAPPGGFSRSSGNASPPSSFSRGPGGPSQSPYSTGRSPADTSRMQQALSQRNYQVIKEENQGVRSRGEDIQKMGPNLPVQDRLKLPLINQMYRQGTNIVDDGRTKQDESKINYGIQQINEANKRLERLNGPGAGPPNGPDGSQQNGNGRRGR